MEKTDRTISVSPAQSKKSAPAREPNWAKGAKAVASSAAMLRTQAGKTAWGDARRRSGQDDRRMQQPNMAREHVYFVYVLASKANGILYIGITDNLIRCIQAHHEGLVPGFSKRYAVKLLVYFETHSDINAAILREKRIKRWRRQWKLELIEAHNPHWRDLWLELTGQDQ